MITPPSITEADLLAEIISPDEVSLSEEAANFIANLRFSDRARRRMDELCDRANRGELTAQEESEIDAYRRVGLLVDLLQAKARLSLRRASNGSD